MLTSFHFLMKLQQSGAESEAAADTEAGERASPVQAEQSQDEGKAAEDNETVDIDLTDPEVIAAANKIQAGMKGYKVRKEYRQQRVCEVTWPTQHLSACSPYSDAPFVLLTFGASFVETWPHLADCTGSCNSLSRDETILPCTDHSFFLLCTQWCGSSLHLQILSSM